MDVVKRFKNHYQKGFMPWAHKKADFNLVEVVKQWPVKPCRVLEAGCGTETDAIWLASQNFYVTACDISEIAIGIAKDIVDAVEDHFRILSLYATHFCNEEKDPAPAWVCLMR